MLLLLLSCLLPTTNGKNCLQCWQELPALIDYDLQILWGTPGPPAELSQSLHSLFMDNQSSPENSYLGQDHLEEAAGTLFTHIDKAIKKLRDDKPSLLEEVRVLKQQFSKELEDVSEGLKDKGESCDSCSHPSPSQLCLPPQKLSLSTISPSWAACNESCDIRSTLEVISCTTCQKHFLTCQDPAVCPGAWTGKNFRWAMGIGIALPLATLAGDVTFSGSRRRKRRRRRRHKRDQLATCHLQLNKGPSCCQEALLPLGFGNSTCPDPSTWGSNSSEVLRPRKLHSLLRFLYTHAL
ncbi:testis-expressed protein 51 isoform X4 [Bos indicus]|uniref:Testis-expressed protein 51 isoform X4 n=1 Tax=Bos indicus TaxID=9915 RepID=A0ABM4QQ24_BOSIN|nr:testis-expressed protein 51 isoform X5 [Bos taurus]XP_061296311.1 testis-expressed protein 51 isoform X5 [Bos javanicus]